MPLSPPLSPSSSPPMPGRKSPLLVAQRNVEAVHAVVDAVRDELREHGRGDAVQRGVAEVVLPRAAERRVDHELLGLGVVGGRRADGRDIRPVPGLGHGERTGDLETHDAGQPLVVVLLGAQLQHGRAEEAPLHARLDLQARVGGDELREAGDVRAVVRLAAVLLRERAVHAAVVDEQVHLAEHALAVLLHAEPVDAPERRVLDHLAGLAAGVAPGAEQQVGDRVDIDAGLGCFGGGVRRGRGAAGGRAPAGGGLLGTDGGVGHGVTFRWRERESLRR